MTKRKKPRNVFDGKLEAIGETFDATDRRTTGATTNDPAQAFKPAGIEFREKVLGKTQNEYDAIYNPPNIISKKGAKKK